MKYESKDLVLAGAFGWLCGMRSMSGPATAGRTLLKDELVGNALAAGAAGEMLADKHPDMPNRNSPPALAGRVIMGAATGAVIMVSGRGWSPHARFIRSRSRRMWPLRDGETLEAAAIGGIIGGVTAAVSTQISFRARRWIGTRTEVPGAALGAAEDALVYGTAVLLSQNLE